MNSLHTSVQKATLFRIDKRSYFGMRKLTSLQSMDNIFPIFFTQQFKFATVLAHAHLVDWSIIHTNILDLPREVYLIGGIATAQ